ncbi:hypothetical protein M2447_002671 [Ereboglobus sp. PH5-10]|uniref:hypothetical protein n=1 Tax=Ereboglobus sp. PH5-10 TaxID=2940629 RepID=UPI0024066AED|nr:hypothetical protein [Ereboglobus sp. PH5-10]MDF9828547.1 hypothetical protein [Ereboglobus sp. PH5-10]
MSLREEIERRRMAHVTDNNAANKPNGNSVANGVSDTPSITTPASTPMASPSVFLRVMKLDKQCWVLPWACFQGVSYEPACKSDDDTDKCERLHLVFMRYEVTVIGHNLAGVVDAIAETNLCELHEVADKYLPAINPTHGAIIEKIEANRQ